MTTSLQSSTAPPSSSTSSTPKITVHWLTQSRSQRILWLLTELGLPYTLTIYHRDSGFRAPSTLKSVHPLGKSPVITIEEVDGSTITLAESGFIFEYLCGRFGGQERGLWPERHMKTMMATQEGGVGVKDPPESEAWRMHAFYMHFVEGSLTPPLVTGIIVDGIRNAPVPFFIRPITRSIAAKIDDTFLSGEYKTNFGFVESQLPSNTSTTTASPNTFPSITGLSHLTAADILLSFPLLAAREKGLVTKEKYPRICRFCQACEAREGYRSAVERVEREVATQDAGKGKGKYEYKVI